MTRVVCVGKQSASSAYTDCHTNTLGQATPSAGACGLKLSECASTLRLDTAHINATDNPEVTTLAPVNVYV